MTATTTGGSVATGARPGRVVLVLARFEAGRALRHPLTWTGVAGSLWMMWLLGGDVAPILQRDSVFLAGAMLPLAAATLLVTNHAVLRQRHTTELLASQPRGDNTPIAGVQAGVLASVALALLLQAAGLAYLSFGEPIGWIDWWELLAGPAMVGAFGTGGALLGRRLRHPIVAPLTLVAVGALTMTASPDAQLFSSEPSANVEWLAPWMFPSAFSPVEDLVARPSELHLVYLVVLGALLAVWGLTLRRAARLVMTGLAGAFVVAVAAISLGLPTDPRAGLDWREAAAFQICETHDGVEYCAFPFYRPWIERWAETVAAVDVIRPTALTRVLQRPANIGFDEPGDLEGDGLALASTEWDRQGAVPMHRFRLALLAAHSAVGLPTTQETRPYTQAEIDSIVAQNPDYEADLRAVLEEEGRTPRPCSAAGQARAVVAVWMAASALERGGDTLRMALVDAPASPTFRLPLRVSQNDPTLVGRSDAELAQALLALPPAEVVGVVEEHWEEIRRPETTSAQLAAWFALPVPGTGGPDSSTAPCD